MILQRSDNIEDFERVFVSFGVQFKKIHKHPKDAVAPFTIYKWFGNSIVYDYSFGMFVYDGIAYTHPVLLVSLGDDGKYHLILKGYWMGKYNKLIDECFLPEW